MPPEIFPQGKISLPTHLLAHYPAEYPSRIPDIRQGISGIRPDIKKWPDIPNIVSLS